MRHRFLGRSGLQVSELFLGTMLFGVELGEQASHHIMDAYAEAGGTFLDTADVYAQGGSEEILGRRTRTATTSPSPPRRLPKAPMGGSTARRCAAA